MLGSFWRIFESSSHFRSRPESTTPRACSTKTTENSDLRFEFSNGLSGCGRVGEFFLEFLLLLSLRQSEREMVSGESHYFLGRRYRLRVVEHKRAGKVVLRNTNTIELRVRPEADATKRERVLQRWYRQHLRDAVPPLIAKWEASLDVQITGWGIKKMKIGVERPFAEQNGPQMAHGLLRWIAANVVSDLL